MSPSPGDLLLLYTDGKLETRRAGGGFFGERRLETAVVRLAGGGAGDIADGLLAASLVWRLPEDRRSITCTRRSCLSLKVTAPIRPL